MTAKSISDSGISNADWNIDENGVSPIGILAPKASTLAFTEAIAVDDIEVGIKPEDDLKDRFSPVNANIVRAKTNL